MSERPDWLTVGQEVATITSGIGRGSSSVRFATIAKVGKRDVVLSDGQRFNANHGLTRHDGSTWSGWSTALVKRDDPAVAKTVAEIEQRNREAAARAACDRFLRREITAFDLILALAPLTGVAEQIAALDTMTPTNPTPGDLRQVRAAGERSEK